MTLIRLLALRPWVLAAIGMVGLGQAAVVAPAPLLVQRAFELASPDGAGAALALTVGLFVVLVLAGEALTAVLRTMAQGATKAGVQRLRDRVAAALMRLPVDDVERRRPHWHDVAVHDTERIDALVSAVIAQALPAVLLVIGLAISLAVVQPLFGLAAVAGAVVVAGVERAVRWRTTRVVESSHHAFAAFSEGLWTMLLTALATRAYAAERQTLARRHEEAASLRDAALAAARAHTVALAIGRAAAAVVFGGLILTAGLLVQRGLMSLPAMLAVSAALALLRAPLNTLSLVAPAIQEGRQAWRRVHALLDSVKDDDTSSAGVTPPARAVVRVDDLSYAFGDTVLFEHVSFALHPGEVVALTGPNGAGKSTLVKLLLGVLSPAHGAIRVGDTELSLVDRRLWRRRVGVVLQRPFWIDGTIRENLMFGCDDASDEDVRDACRIAAMDDLLLRWPDGLQTIVGKRGRRLSDGEAQRLSIARALVRRPALLLLDEPSNHLEDAVASDILDRLRSWPLQPAVLLVTHRASLVGRAARRLTLRDGGLSSS